MFILYKYFVATVATKFPYMSRAHASSLHAHVFFMYILFFGGYSGYSLKAELKSSLFNSLRVATSVAIL